MRNRDDEMLDMYLSESDQNMQMLESLLLAAQSAGTLSQLDIAEAFRLVHTLKSASSMMQYDALEMSSHLLKIFYRPCAARQGWCRKRATYTYLACVLSLPIVFRSSWGRSGAEKA